jgi:phenylalanyl-tRNA synthetase alpha chain
MPSIHATLSPDQLARDLAVRDLTDPGEGDHAIQFLIDAAVASLAAAWNCQVRWHRGPRVVPVEDNYDRLRIPPEAISRDVRYSRYVDRRRMLRSHATAMVPAALRGLAADPADDALLVCPGVVYRRDAIDRLHGATPHQLDLWRITRRPLDDRDLEQMLDLVVEALTPGRSWRWQARVHPYTVDGHQVDIGWDGTWVEVAECGLAHPEVLERAGLDGWSGLALGLGLDRLLMLRKGIPDIRLLRSTDPRIAGQLTDLAPWRPISAMPSVRRDLSVAVDAHEAAEDLGDRVREALGPDADAVEEVIVLAETGYEQLPAQAVARLGIRRGQKNVLVRVVLRHLERTLTDEEANRLRDRIYAALHRGTRHQWAAPSRMTGTAEGRVELRCRAPAPDRGAVLATGVSGDEAEPAGLRRPAAPAPPVPGRSRGSRSPATTGRAGRPARSRARPSR